MAVAEVRFKSESFIQFMSYSIILPETGEGPYPVVLQLHGNGGDHRSWIERSGITRYAEAYPFAIVFPSGGTSGYLNWKKSDHLHKQYWESLIVDDIPAHLRRHFNVTDGPWGIGGLSMGGFGAMRLGLKYPEQFASIWSHSSAFHIQNHLDPDLIDQQNIDEADLTQRLRSMVEQGTHMPTISFDCGTEDSLIEHNRQLDAVMTELGIAHHFAEHPGGHNWDYWDVHIHKALAQHARVLSQYK